MIPTNKAWKGDEKLWKVFWIYHVLVSVSAGVAFQFIGAAYYQLRGNESLDFDPAGLAIFIAGLIAASIWAVWCYVSLWRCALNTRWSGWGYIVRAYVVLQVVWVSLSIADGIAPLFLS